MSVQTQIDRISRAVSDALAALTDKGVTVPAGTKVDGLAELIAAIEAGGGSGGGCVTGTFAGSTYMYPYVIEHGLGKTPQGFAIWMETETVNSNRAELKCGIRLFTLIEGSNFNSLFAFSYRNATHATNCLYSSFSSNMSANPSSDCSHPDSELYPTKSSDGFTGVMINKKYLWFDIYSSGYPANGAIWISNTYRWVVW